MWEPPFNEEPAFALYSFWTRSQGIVYLLAIARSPPLMAGHLHVSARGHRSSINHPTVPTIFVWNCQLVWLSRLTRRYESGKETLHTSFHYFGFTYSRGCMHYCLEQKQKQYRTRQKMRNLRVRGHVKIYCIYFIIEKRTSVAYSYHSESFGPVDDNCSIGRYRSLHILNLTAMKKNRIMKKKMLADYANLNDSQLFVSPSLLGRRYRYETLNYSLATLNLCRDGRLHNISNAKSHCFFCRKLFPPFCVSRKTTY